MRILHVNKFLYRRGGAEAYMVEVATRQAAAGHDVELFGMQHPENPPGLGLAHTFPTLVEHDQPHAGATDRARALGRMLWSTSARRGMAQAVAEFRPDVVHLHNIYHGLSPSILGPAAAAGAAIVMTLHDYKLACPTYQFLDRGTTVCEACVDGGFRQAVVRRCKDGSLLKSAAGALELGMHTRFGAYEPVHRILCPSRFLEGRMRAADVQPDKLQVLNNFVDSETIAPGDGARGPLVYAGRLSSEKGVDLLVEAMGRLPDAELVVAGEGRERPALEQRAAALAPGRVQFVGRLDRADVLALLRRATAMVLPSRWYENQPMSIIEAFACGTPVVASDIGGNPELVLDGDTGVLFPPDDVAGLAAALRRVLDDPAGAADMGARARTVAVRDFSPVVHLDGLHAQYEIARREALGVAA